MSFVTAIALLLVGMIIYQLSSREVVGKGGWVTTRDKNPVLYWFTITVEIALVAWMIELLIHGFSAKGS